MANDWKKPDKEERQGNAGRGKIHKRWKLSDAFLPWATGKWMRFPKVGDYAFGRIEFGRILNSKRRRTPPSTSLCCFKMEPGGYAGICWREE
jgi:hypothetical protein